MTEKQRIAVLGGGIAGLTTALELTSTPELRAQYDVTVHQLGWRAGGKCATGRDAEHGDRILEHGLHLWFSGYANAFALLKQCYDELDRPEDQPLARMHDAWSQLPGSVLYDEHDDEWTAHPLTFPEAPGLPWDAVTTPRIWDLVVEAVEFVRHRPLRRVSSPRYGPISAALRRIGNSAENSLYGMLRRYCDWRHHHPGLRRIHLHPATWALRLIRMLQWRRARAHIDDSKVRHRFTAIDVYLTCLIGAIDDEIPFHGFSSIDDEEFRDWLHRHGARDVTLHSPTVRVVYDQVFAGSTGPSTTATDPVASARPGVASTAAGAALYGIFRTALPGPGSIMWQATAGMGDTAIAPMYETLAARGVEFEFFHAVEHIGVDSDRRVVDRITMRRQARPIDGAYDPLRDVDVSPAQDGSQQLRCWPSEPVWDRLEDGDQLRASGIDFEAGAYEPDAETIDLSLGADFDQVVLAISAAALPAICEEVIAASPPFGAMLDNTHTTMTQAFQIWLKAPLSDVGFRYGHAATTTYREPIDTGADNSQVTWTENWPPRGDQSHEKGPVWYFCGVLDDAEGDDAESTDARARAGAIDQLRNIGGQWPDAVADGDFRWDLLAGGPNTSGPDRFDEHYHRANWTPTERYVQTPPGTVRARLAADESGLDNLILAGDWTKNSFNFGAVEATVMSGMAASRSICGSPKTIAMEGHDWLA